MTTNIQEGDRVSTPANNTGTVERLGQDEYGVVYGFVQIDYGAQLWIAADALTKTMAPSPAKRRSPTKGSK